MSRINTNVTALLGARVLNNNNATLAKTLERLSTGYRINRGSDDPAGLIASESLRGEIAAIKSSITNAERASGLVSTAEGALGEISDKLIKMQELVAGAASSGGTTQAEIDANQAQVDGIISSINRIASETSFMGSKLLDGSMGFKTTTTGGIVTPDVLDVSVNMAKGITTDTDLVITTAVAAAKADGGVLAVVEAGADGETLTYEITGAKGSATITVGDGTLVADLSAAINALSSITGVIASGGKIASKDWGADQFVRVELISQSDAGGVPAGLTVGLDDVASGADAVVTINGAAVVVDGYKASYRTSMIDVTFTMTNDLIDLAAETETITIEANGGATFLLSPNIGLGGQETIGLNSVAAHRLGDGAYGHLSDMATGKAANLTDAAGTAQSIISGAISQVASIRGRLGSFLNDTVESAVNSLNVALENVSAAESAIRDTDFASATAELTRNQVLVQAATSVLGIASAQPQNVLGLL